MNDLKTAWLMKMKAGQLIFLLVFASGCKGQESKCKESPFQKYEFVISNKDTSQFGFQYFEDDESYSVRSVALSPDGKFAFFNDAGHGNVKRLDLKNGTLKASKVFDRIVSEPVAVLFDIAFLNDYVFVTTSRGIVILNKELDYIGFEFGEFQLPSFTEFSIVRNDSVCVEADIVHSSSESTYRKVLVLVGIEPSIWQKKFVNGRDQTKVAAKRRLGKPYSIQSSSSSYQIRNEFGCFKLAHPIPNLDKYFTARNLDFNSKAIIYFEVTPTSVVIYSHTLR